MRYGRFAALRRLLVCSRFSLSLLSLSPSPLLRGTVGDDGHVGSLYPGRDEVLDVSGRWVLPVEMKVPGSITLSLPVMTAARRMLIAACGVSDKYPQGKSEAMGKAIEDEAQTPDTFPAVGLRSRAFWVLDATAGATLGVDYMDCFAFGGASQNSNFFK